MSKRFGDNSVKEQAHAQFDENISERPNGDTKQEGMMVSHGETVFMQTANTEIQNPETNSSVRTRLLLDCGSQRTYITKDLADSLGLKCEGTEELKLFTFGGSQAKIIKTDMTSFNLKLKSGKYMKISANVVPVISGNVQRNTLEPSLHHYFCVFVETLDLADTLPNDTESSANDIDWK